ncbi:BON domain-containing protein [Pelagibacterium sp. H642]|uniref:BON domain-containing protein n=1 Tax=Pelagibacterium sp. H642 TaxID=1881069 RepID=UPI0028158CF6|nr:BON domain-containing protein [Pelagibacterium sp. H642]WMT90607.1 BON domain-containing protein [Pelagibacterium sp. H642]
MARYVHRHGRTVVSDRFWGETPGLSRLGRPDPRGRSGGHYGSNEDDEYDPYDFDLPREGREGRPRSNQGIKRPAHVDVGYEPDQPVPSGWGLADPAGERHRRGYAGRGPKSYQRRDDRILEDVSDRLMEDPFLDASGIEVSVNAGEVRLDGSVDARADKRRAEDVAEMVSGVGNVQNNLRVQHRDVSRS